MANTTYAARTAACDDPRESRVCMGSERRIAELAPHRGKKLRKCKAIGNQALFAACTEGASGQIGLRFAIEAEGAGPEVGKLARVDAGAHQPVRRMGIALKEVVADFVGDRPTEHDGPKLETPQWWLGLQQRLGDAYGWSLDDVRTIWERMRG